MSEDQGTAEDRPKPPPPPPPRQAPPAPPKHVAALPDPDAAPRESPAGESEAPPPAPQPPQAQPASEPEPAPVPERAAASKPAASTPAPKTRSFGSLLRGVIWIVVLALIALGIYAYIHHKNSSDDNAPTRTVVALPKQLLGAARVVSPADRKLRKHLNAHLYKQDAKAEVADYVTTVSGSRQVSYVVTGFTGDPGGTLDYGPPSVGVVLKHFLIGVTAKDLRKVGSVSGGVLTKCGTVTQSGRDVRACIWRGPGRAAMVSFPGGGSTAEIAARTRKIRAAVEHAESDSA